jgi:hypothetical protein
MHDDIDASRRPFGIEDESIGMRREPGEVTVVIIDEDFGVVLVRHEMDDIRSLGSPFNRSRHNLCVLIACIHEIGLDVPTFEGRAAVAG